MDPGPNPANLMICLISWILGIPIFRTVFEKIDPPWPLRANHYVEKDPIWILFMLGFRHKLSKVFVFTNQIKFFHEDPVSSVRPSETSSGKYPQVSTWKSPKSFLKELIKLEKIRLKVEAPKNDHYGPETLHFMPKAWWRIYI